MLRDLKGLQRQGIIEIGYGNIAIPDKAALSAAAGRARLRRPDDVGRQPLALLSHLSRRMDRNHELLPRADFVPSHFKRDRFFFTHRFLVYFLRGWDAGRGGALGLFASTDAASLTKTIDPIHNRGVGLVIGPRSYHAVAAVHNGERYTVNICLRSVTGEYETVRPSPWLMETALLAEAWARVGEPTWAAVLYARLAPWPDIIVSAMGGAVSGSAHHPLGLLAASLGRHDAADVHFAKAAAVHTRMGAPAFLARTRLEWARLLLRQIGERVEAPGSAVPPS